MHFVLYYMVISSYNDIQFYFFIFVIKIQLLLLIPKYISILIYKSIAKCMIWETNHSEYNMRNSPQPVRWIISRGPLRSSDGKCASIQSKVFVFCISHFFFLGVYILRYPFANIPRRLARANISQITRSAIKNAKRCTGPHGN